MRTSVKIVLLASVTAALGVALWKRRKIAQAADVVVQEVSTVAYDLRDKLPWSNKPSPELLDAIGKASAKYPKVPVLLLVAVARNESNFRIGTCDNPLKAGTFRRERGSWSKRKDSKIPGSDKTWADLYQPEEWGSYGPFQILPMNFMGTGKPLSAGEPLCKAHEPHLSAEVAAGMLEASYKKYGNWVNALAAYNGGPGGARSSKIIGGYVMHIAKHLTDLGPQARALLPETIAGLGGFGALRRRRDSYPVYDVTGRIVDWVDVY